MKKFMFTVLALYALAFLGCATPAIKVEAEKPKPTHEFTPAPEPSANEAAVFGKVTLTETVNKMPMPIEDQAATLYMSVEGKDMTLKISCSDSGEFGVYLPPGSYRIVRVVVGDYNFTTDFALNVPADKKAVYAGTLVLDGEPTGVDTLTGKSNFAYSVLDEQKDYEARIKKALPGVNVAFYKSLLTPRGGLVTSHNPSRVFRAKDVENELGAHTGAVEEVAGGVIMSISYIINPVWLFTYFSGN